MTESITSNNPWRACLTRVGQGIELVLPFSGDGYLPMNKGLAA
jgi:hypothetical protein